MPPKPIEVERHDSYNRNSSGMREDVYEVLPFFKCLIEAVHPRI